MEDLLKQVLQLDSTNVSNTEDINSTFFDNVEKEMSLEEFNENLSTSNQNQNLLERVSLISKYFRWIPISADIISNYSKHLDLSSQLREKANDFFRAKNYQSALSCYNLAIMYSPIESESLGLAFANRSAVFVATGKAEEALLDMDLAIECNYPEKLMKKLDERRRKCKTMLEKSQDQEQDKRLRCEEERAKRRKFCEGILFRVKQSNPLMPAAENFVQVRFDDTRGRQLSVNRDIPAGTVLIVEKPFVSIVKESTKWDTSHCHFCFKKIIRGIPCNTCVFAMYCDNNCRQKAYQEYHRFECPCMAYFHCNSTPRYVLLALRVVCKLGPEKLYHILTDKEIRDQLESPIEKYNSDSYEPIYHLVSHTSMMDPVDLYMNGFNSVMITNILASQSDFFQKHMRGSNFFNFVASVILRHIENIPCNSISLDEADEKLSGVSLWESMYGMKKDHVATLIRSIQFPQKAAGVFAVSSLMNHSCDPNVTRVTGLSDGMLAIVATRALKANEEILTSYSRCFNTDSIDLRRDYLTQNYYFDCTCIACTLDWPILTVVMKKDPILCCRSCSSQFFHEDKGSKEFKKCLVQGKSNSCALCKQLYSPNKLLEELNKNSELFFQAYRTVLANEPLEAIRVLMPVMKYFQFAVSPPFSKSYMCQDIYKVALELIVHFS